MVPDDGEHLGDRADWVKGREAQRRRRRRVAERLGVSAI
jgi:hypothetical protein